MKILMLSWRDMKHPKMGGAEIVTDIYLNGLSKLGHEITLFTADYPNSLIKESYNNYNIIRKGNQLTVSFHGLLYAKKHENEYDLIIDQVNTLPFFTPLLIKKEKRIAFFHQLCRNIWFYESIFPLSLIGFILETLYLKLYRNTKTFVVSESTKKDLIKYAWAKPNNILVLENQINFKPINRIKKKNNYFIFVGRPVKGKKIEDCIKALSLIKDKKIKLYIISNGNNKYKNYLINLTRKLNLDKRVLFLENISNEKRNQLMAKATAILVTSVREGWGLIVTEANANGTLAITYNVPGLIDANKTGFVTKNNNHKELARLMKYSINNPKVIDKKSQDSLEFARQHADWTKNIRRLEKWVRG